MKKIILFLMLASIGVLQAQKVKFEKRSVFIDDVKCLKYDASDPNNVMISDLEGKQTIYLKFIRTGVGHNGGLYTKIVFAEQKKSFTSQSYIFTRKLLVKKMIKDELIKNCTFDESKMDKFIMRYDENVKERNNTSIIIIQEK